MTSRLSLGQRMVRLEDGKLGLVEPHNGEPRILFEDRGEKLVAGKQEKWDVFEPGSARVLRDEEKLQVALTADRVLRAIVRSEPNKLWEPIDLSATPFDEGLFRVVFDYLGERK